MESLKKAQIDIVESMTQDIDIKLWIEGLATELSKIEGLLKRRGDSDMMGYFIRRVIQYKIEYPSLNSSGDWELVKRIILAELRLDDLESSQLEELADNPKLMDAFTRLHQQLQKDIEAIGATSRDKRKDMREGLKILIDMQQIKQGGRDSDLEWLEKSKVIALPEG